MMHKAAKGIYVHVPYCLSKCSYCDFLSFEKKHGMDEYVKTLIDEIGRCDLKDEISTVYIGGGTPTALPSRLLCKILDAVAAFDLTKDAEITVEANPGTLTLEYLKEIKKHGANRLSFGLQTTHPQLLKSIGRIHSMEDFEQNYHAARQAGFDNINIDLMFALPNQTVAQWQQTLEKIVTLTPEHISAYSLTPAEGTPLYEDLENEKIVLPSDDIDRKMYHFARRFLASHGYGHYEISNFAKPGFESRHNINCWRRVPYIGFGLGAHSFDDNSRWCNTGDIAEYLNGNQEKHELVQLSNEEASAEAIILGLRLMDGIDAGIVTQDITALIQEGLLIREVQQGARLRLTEKGMDLANRVFGVFLEKRNTLRPD